MAWLVLLLGCSADPEPTGSGPQDTATTTGSPSTTDFDDWVVPEAYLVPAQVLRMETDYGEGYTWPLVRGVAASEDAFVVNSTLFELEGDLWVQQACLPQRVEGWVSDLSISDGWMGRRMSSPDDFELWSLAERARVPEPPGAPELWLRDGQLLTSGPGVVFRAWDGAEWAVTDVAPDLLLQGSVTLADGWLATTPSNEPLRVWHRGPTAWDPVDTSGLVDAAWAPAPATDGARLAVCQYGDPAWSSGGVDLAVYPFEGATLGARIPLGPHEDSFQGCAPAVAGPWVARNVPWGFDVELFRVGADAIEEAWLAPGYEPPGYYGYGSDREYALTDRWLFVVTPDEPTLVVAIYDLDDLQVFDGDTSLPMPAAGPACPLVEEP